MIKNLLGDDDSNIDEGLETPQTGDPGLSVNDSQITGRTAEPAESFAETTRRSGLAWSAGVVFFASVVFMLVLGWGADLLLGSSPWGIVGGIVIGSLIGFVQLFRLSSQIFKK